MLFRDQRFPVGGWGMDGGDWVGLLTGNMEMHGLGGNKEEELLAGVGSPGVRWDCEDGREG